MAPKRRTKPSQTSANIRKPKSDLRFLTAKSGKLSKTNLPALFSSPKVWENLTPTQQLRVLTTLSVDELFGPDHPIKLEGETSDTKGKGSKKAEKEPGYLNYFTTPNPLSTRVSPSPNSTSSHTIEQSSEVYFDLSRHLERFREHLVEGRFDERWLRESKGVSERRARGEFDGLGELGGEGDGDIGMEGWKRVEEVRRRRGERVSAGLE